MNNRMQICHLAVERKTREISFVMRMCDASWGSRMQELFVYMCV
jgi:hypothetical protein